MINIEELRADIEAGTPGDWSEGPSIGDVISESCGADVTYACNPKDRPRIARLPQLEREYLVMREALKKAHDTLHECTVVLSSNDCETVAAVMADARKALGETQ